MARQYTENQSKAIDHQGHNILVAASAGSGKTTVLIERLVRKILAGDRVDQFLIVTFTNAAAAEMKERLEVAITDQIAQTSGDQKRFLQDQLALLPVANVSTIDSFALKLIDTYYYKIGLDPSYRLLADQAEVALLKDSVVQGVLADFYDPDHPDHQAFLDLVNNFANPNYDADLKANVLRLADFAVARPDGAEWLAALAAPGQSADPVAVSDRADYRKFLQPKVLSAVTQASAAFDLVLADLEGLPELEKTYNFIAETKERLAAINTAIASQASYDDLRALVDSDWGKMPQSKTAKVFKEDPDLAALLDHARSTFNAFFAKSGTVGAVMALKKTVFALSEDQWQVVNTAGDKLVTTLVKVTQAFLAAFTAQKRADNLLDFADAEQLSLQILDQDDVRELVQSQFKELLIDEYQDINRLQESFLQKLSNQHNMYMVGDVKQSIYGFRQADPSLFTGKYFAFAQEGSEDERIELAENFRSENNVTTVINQIFTQLMDQELGDIPYQDSAKLIAAASYPDFVPPVFQVNLIEQADGESADFAGNENADEEADGDSADQPEKRASQYQLLAQKVQDLIKNSQVYDQKAGVMRPVRYSDIAILTRSKGGYVELIRHFNTAGIPIQSDGVGNYYQVMEVYLVLDMLRVIDNPHQDIPLAAVLRSPIFGLTENDLAEIRLADRDHDFYTALVAWAQTKPQGQGILLALEAWQRLARQNDLVGLVLAIYQDTGWLDYVGTLPGGAQRQANLHALYEKAGAFQDNGQSGLYAFIRYIEEIQKNGQEVGEVVQDSAEETVALMTIHASKGLEFPIVILPELEKKLNTMDLTGKVLIQKDAGVGIEFVEGHAKVKMPTMAKYAVKEALQGQSWSEEMRLLYVALTRAKQQLYLVATVPNQEKATASLRGLYEEASSFSGQFLPKDLRLRSKSYLDWIMITMARLQVPALTDWLGKVDTVRLPSKQTPTNGAIELIVHPEEEILQSAGGKIPATENDQAKDEPQAADPNPTETVEADQGRLDLDTLVRSLSFTYHNEAATRTAAYQSVSEIKHLFEDPDQSQLVTLNLDEQGRAVPGRPQITATPEINSQEDDRLMANMPADDDAESLFENMPAEDPENQGDFGLDQGQFDQSEGQASHLDQTDQINQGQQTPSQANQVLDSQAHVLTTNDLPMPAFEEDGTAKPAPTAVGTATHLVLQLVDFTQLQTLESLQDLLQSLVNQEKVLEPVATLVDLDQVLAFLNSDFAQDIARHNQTLHRESPFAMLAPANQVYPAVTDNEPILIHGIIDGYYLDEQKHEITLFDYKTDYVPKKVGPDQKDRLAKIKDQYTGQVRLYQQALRQEYPDYRVKDGVLILLAGDVQVTINQAKL